MRSTRPFHLQDVNANADVGLVTVGAGVRVLLCCRSPVAGKDDGAMTTNDIHYLEAIKRRLMEFKDALADTAAFSLPGEAFADEIDWLDCFIEKHSRDHK
jgi:hypothetical protein